MEYQKSSAPLSLCSLLLEINVALTPIEFQIDFDEQAVFSIYFNNLSRHTEKSPDKNGVDPNQFKLDANNSK